MQIISEGALCIKMTTEYSRWFDIMKIGLDILCKSTPLHNMPNSERWGFAFDASCFLISMLSAYLCKLGIGVNKT